MIHYTTGNIFNEPEGVVIVIPVNTVGVMGKGLALQAKNLYPDVWHDYKYLTSSQSNKDFTPGDVVSASDEAFLLFATKEHWRNPSRLEWIDKGLKIISNLSPTYYPMIAIPPIGCGLGGLNWDDVNQMIINRLIDNPITFKIYHPKEWRPNVSNTIRRDDHPDNTR